MSDIPKAFAHKAEDGRIHLLEEHLIGTAELAMRFGDKFGVGQWAMLAGLWHDLGKYSDEFQEYIRNNIGMVDHSTFGANKAQAKYGLPGRFLAYLIAGHHTGLPDWQSEYSGNSGLMQRLNRKIPQAKPPDNLLSMPLPKEKPKAGTDPSLLIRMLFSCLVDADYLDTESFMQPDKSEQRGAHPGLNELLLMFNRYMNRIKASVILSPVNIMRADILKQCVLKAKCLPAIFSLSVPTGGGKTLSSMAFALNHAVKHAKKRIIYVIPYTSIIEQTADQFKDVFGDAVIEHHSNIEVADGEYNESFNKNRLAAENWDAPIIITTNVQFFESLYASRPSKCRKLHNIANSVVVLDEAQLLPPDFLEPVCKVLVELNRNYGVSILLSTATQPALGSRQTSGFKFEGMSEIQEIIDDPISLNSKSKRVLVNIPNDLSTPIPWEELSRELLSHDKVLCVVNRRDDCRELHKLMPEGTIHLSAMMCGAHRSEVIKDIRLRLKNKAPLRVISTQLVEAGVDIDFPVVYRALAGLDSIAQAAGRCNREGLLAKGEVFVFVPQSETPQGILRQAAEITRQLLFARTGDPLSPELFENFFNELYWIRGKRLDAKGILKDLSPDEELRFSFRTASEKFRIIDDSQYSPVMVRYGKGADLVDRLIKKGPERWLMRKLQRYIVNVPRYSIAKLKEAGEIEETLPGTYVQSQLGLYDQALGLIYKGQVLPTDGLIV